jgi:hypothetical protein
MALPLGNRLLETLEGQADRAPQVADFELRGLTHVQEGVRLP